jgi:hypothetical protein
MNRYDVARVAELIGDDGVFIPSITRPAPQSTGKNSALLKP